jgi:hypothetical protein
MTKNSFFSVLTSMIVFASALFFFSSCEKEDTLGVSTAPVTTRTSEPDAPAILDVPEGNYVSFHTYADGVQIYICTETAPGVYTWVFKAPLATLYTNADFNGEVGTHYAGPFWESNSGSKVKAALLQKVTVDTTAIPWLLLGMVTSEGPGIFEGTTFIQRVNTVGGLAPLDGAHAGNVGEEIGVPYTAEYYFYKAE